MTSWDSVRWRRLLEDPSISDIMVNGPERTFVERGGKVSMANIRFRDTAHLQNICQRIAAAVGRRVDESSPMVDARLKDGSRVNIVFPPLALDGPYLSIRKFGRKGIDFAKLVEYKALTLPVARVLEIAAQARLNVIISGGTGSGKTTLMNAMSRMIDHRRARGHHRGRRGTAIAAAACGALGNAARQPGRPRRNHPA